MPESKPKKSSKVSPAKKTARAKKITDITKPSGPSKSSRSIIVNNRPIMHDPMVSAGDKAEDPVLEPSEETKVEVKRLGKKISPENGSTTSSQAAPKDDAKTEGLKTVQPISPDFSEADTESKDDDSGPKEKLLNLDEKPSSKNLTDLLTDNQAEVADKKEQPADKEADDKTTDAGETNSQNESAANDSAKQSDEAETKEAESLKDKSDDTAPEPSKTDQDASEGQSESPDMSKVEPGKTSVDNPTEEESDATDTEGADKTQPKPPKGRQLTAEQAKAIESGRYFLPIQTADNRRARRDAIIFAILGIVLVLVWLDVLLDANLISLGGIQPLTNFL